MRISLSDLVWNEVPGEGPWIAHEADITSLLWRRYPEVEECTYRLKLRRAPRTMIMMLELRNEWQTISYWPHLLTKKVFAEKMADARDLVIMDQRTAEQGFERTFGEFDFNDTTRSRRRVMAWLDEEEWPDDEF